MKKTKTENKDIIFIALVVLTIIVVLLSMFAYSKYAETIEGDAKASIANWDFLVNGGSSITADLDLLSTLEKKKGVKEDTMAPGTEGSFSVEIDAGGSEVGVQYKVELKELQNVPQNLKFYSDPGRETPLEGNRESYFVTGLIPFDPDNESSDSMRKEVNIYWKWEYETQVDYGDVKDEDAEDTSDSENNISGTIVISGWQVRPDTDGSTVE